MKVKCYAFGYSHHSFVAFWSESVNRLIEVISRVKARAFTTHHDIASRFLNIAAFKARGKPIKGRKTGGSRFSDLELP